MHLTAKQKCQIATTYGYHRFYFYEWSERVVVSSTVYPNVWINWMYVLCMCTAHSKHFIIFFSYSVRIAISQKQKKIWATREKNMKTQIKILFYFSLSVFMWKEVCYQRLSCQFNIQMHAAESRECVGKIYSSENAYKVWLRDMYMHVYITTCQYAMALILGLTYDHIVTSYLFTILSAIDVDMIFYPRIFIYTWQTFFHNIYHFQSNWIGTHNAPFILVDHTRIYLMDHNTTNFRSMVRFLCFTARKQCSFFFVFSYWNSVEIDWVK